MTKAPRVPEKAVQAAIVELLEALGGTVYVLGTKRRKGDYHGTMQTPGIPDLLAFLPQPPDVNSRIEARQLWVEVKAHGGKLRKEQREFAEHCYDAEVEHLVGGVDVVIQWATEAGYLVPQQWRSR